MRERGLQFLQVPTSYYDDLRERLQHSKVKISEDLDMVRSLITTMIFTGIVMHYLVYRFRNFIS